MRMTANESKLYLYRFNSMGISQEAVELRDSNDMERVITRAIAMNETITITDELDCLVFRCERGVVCWPRIGVNGVAA